MKMNIDLIKKHHPQYSIGRAKKITLFDEERKRSVNEPSPFSYRAENDQILRMTRYKCF
jgi:hypothetical protein